MNYINTVNRWPEVVTLHCLQHEECIIKVLGWFGIGYENSGPPYKVDEAEEQDTTITTWGDYRVSYCNPKEDVASGAA